MTNLLPTKDKKIIKREFLRRYINVFGLGILILIFVEILFSFASFFFINSFSKGLYDQLKVTESVAKSKNLEVLEAEASEINNLLSSLKIGEEPAVSITDNISKVLDVLSADIKIKAIVFEGNLILLDGRAATRNDLLDFMGDLETVECLAESCFEEITLPVSNLLDEKDIDFSLSLQRRQFNEN